RSLAYRAPTAPAAPPPLHTARAGAPPPLPPRGPRGLGESSWMPVPAVIANAVSDALQPVGVRIAELPMTPSSLWETIRRAQERGAQPHASSAGHPRSEPSSRPPLQ